MRRHFPRLLLTGALLSPVGAYALGLGEIRLHSALNQPFDADIEVVAPTREELAELKVSLAPNDLFARYGIDRPAYLSAFQFAIGRGSDGQVVVKVTSNRSVTEPFVTLLVEASWGRGRVLREYTVLLDPPVFTPTQPQSNQPVTAAQSGAQTEGRIERPAEQAPRQERPAPQAQAEPEARSEPAAPREESHRPAPAAVAGSTYTVERNDTLYRIARAINPEASAGGLNQTMMALFRANPHAFADNINVLRSGSVLRIPDSAAIESISTAQASAEVARQQEAWTSGATRTDTAEQQEHLRLVTPKETPVAEAPAPATPAATDKASPAADTPSGDQAAADKRVAVPSPDMANVQQSVTPPAEQQPAADATPEAAEQTQAPGEAVTPTEPAAEAKPAKQPPPAQPAQESGPSWLDRIGELWWVPVAAGVLLVLGLLLAFLRRRRETAELDSLDTLTSTAPFQPEQTGSALTQVRDRSDAFQVQDDESAGDALTRFDEEEPARDTGASAGPALDDEFDEGPRTRPVAEPQPDIGGPRLTDDTLSSETAVHFDQADALAEADFHMAYGLYDQAADLVKIASSREPARRDLKLKLLEIYFVWGNRELFLDTARELYQTRDQSAPGEWDKVAIMGRQIAPEDAMFEAEAGAHVDLVDVNLEGGENRVDVDLFAEPGGERPQGLDMSFDSTAQQGSAALGAGTGNDTGLDFLLDEPAGRDGADESTRELDALARTQETPTIESPLIDPTSQTPTVESPQIDPASQSPTVESPLIDRISQTVREHIDTSTFAQGSADQTAELSLDDLGLDVKTLDGESATELSSTLSGHDSTQGIEMESLLRSGDTTAGVTRVLRDDEMTQLAPSLGGFDRTEEVPRFQQPAAEDEVFDIEGTGTIYVDQVDLAGAIAGDTVEQPKPDIDSTAALVKMSPLDVDLDQLDGPPVEGDTVRQPADEADRFSDDVFASVSTEAGDDTAVVPADGHASTNKQYPGDMELSELEPVTMSEVGTKLDLARAYMDMGDPDGARSILEEVLQEGTSSQKQEAQRLLDSIR